MKVYAENRKARFDYELLEKYEAGIVLLGQEVKSIRNGRVSINGTYIVMKDNEAYLIGANIPPYQPKNSPSGYNPERSRKLLLNKKEISELIGKGKERGQSMVPLKIYAKNANIKLEFAVVKGKKKSDKRETIKRRESNKEIERALKTRG